MIKKFYRGRIVKTETGAVQFVRNNERRKDFLLITGKHGDLYVPISAIEKALEDQWNADNEARGLRYRHRLASEACCENGGTCERCV